MQNREKDLFYAQEVGSPHFNGGRVDLRRDVEGEIRDAQILPQRPKNVELSAEQIEMEVDLRHVDIVLDSLNLRGAKLVAAPCTKTNEQFQG